MIQQEEDILILRAFLMTLSELNSLSGDVQAEVKKLIPLVKQNFSEAMKQLNGIIHKDTSLDVLFQEETNTSGKDDLWVQSFC